MARPTSGLVSALVVLILVLGVGVTPGNSDLLEDLRCSLSPDRCGCAYFDRFPEMRIVSLQNTSLSLSVREDGKVVFAETDREDPKQAWIVDDRAIGKLGAEEGCQRPFALVNLVIKSGRCQLQAIVPPPSNNPRGPAQVADYNQTTCVKPSMLWTKRNESTADDFFTIRMFTDESRAFNMLLGEMKGFLGVRPTQGRANNVLFTTEPFEQ